MAVLLNSYATKAYSEHPIALWPLDDDAYYQSLITTTNRLMTNWTKSNCTVSITSPSEQSTFPASSFEDDAWNLIDFSSLSLPSITISNLHASGEYVVYTTATNHGLIVGQTVSVSGINPIGHNFSNKEIIEVTAPNKFTVLSQAIDDYISGGVVTSTTKSLELISPELFYLDDLNEDLKTFCLNFYLYQNSLKTNYYEVGYKYYNDVIGADVEVLERITAPTTKEWINFNITYIIPESTHHSIKLIFRLNAEVGLFGQTYQYVINGLSLGQWSEPSCSKSLGITALSHNEPEIPSEIADPLLKYIPANQYGVLTDYAFYTVEDNRVLAQNQSLPIIFGTDSCTRLDASINGKPSFIFPGKGMFYESGRYKKYSLEMWIKIKPNTTQSRRIIGPYSGDYGVYVKEGFISLVVGNEIGSHAISEWYRPILLHLLINDATISLMINGEVVISLPYDQSTISLPSQADWWALYSYSDIDIFQVDCISIYPYIVPSEIAKKRFVWGQGTESLQFINNKFLGQSATIDFSNSEYTANMIYPDITKWDAGYFNNAAVTSDYLSVPEYSLPEINLGDRDLDEWYADNKSINELEYPTGDHPKFVSFRPNIVNGAWNTTGSNWTEQCYFNFPSLNILSDSLSAIYGVFEINQNISSTRPLITFVNVMNNDSFKIEVNELSVIYKLNDSVIYQDNISLNSHFVVGLNFQNASLEFGADVLRFFSSPSSIQTFVGGDGLTTFEGKIYSIGFCNQSNFNELSTHFQNNGIVNISDYGLFTDHFASYTLSPIKRYNRFFLDISVSSQWEEYFPLSYFAGYIKDKDGNSVYDLDYLQINLGYPAMVDYIDVILNSMNWTYSQLFEAYNVPVYKDYEILDNPYISHYPTYNDIKNKQETITKVQQISSSIEPYITFQLLSEGANEPLSSFTYTQDLTDSYVIDAETINDVQVPNKAYITKFPFVDGVIVYPPKTINIEDVAIVIHFIINHKGILSEPLKIKSFEITSKALNDQAYNQIGTKFGVPITPYVKNGFYYDGKEKNPLLIYKKNTPYMYTTESSGIKLLNISSQTKEYGFSMPINKNKAEIFSIGAIQLWMMYDLLSFTQNLPIFEIDYLYGTIEFIITGDISGKRGKITARDKLTRKEFTGLQYFQNGISVANPIIRFDDWSCLGISFDTDLEFSSYSGSINMFGGVMFNNVSYYLSDGLGKVLNTIYRDWRKVKNDGAQDLEWIYWSENNPNGVEWKNVYISGQEPSFISGPKEIYLAQVGVNSDIVDDNLGLSISADVIRSYSDVSWSEYTIIPS